MMIVSFCISVSYAQAPQRQMTEYQASFNLQYLQLQRDDEFNSAQQGLTNRDIGEHVYDKSEPDTKSFTIKISLTWLIIGISIIILSLLINVSFLIYHKCCSQHKKVKCIS